MTAITVLRITPFSEITDEVITTERDGVTLHGLYRLIECRTVDVVRLGEQEFDMWVDDEGALNGSLVNPLATWIAVSLGAPQQVYVGNAVFAACDDEGNTTSLTSDHRDLIHHVLAAFMKGSASC